MHYNTTLLMHEGVPTAWRSVMLRGPSCTPQLGKVTMADIVSVTLQVVGTYFCEVLQECRYRWRLILCAA